MSEVVGKLLPNLTVTLDDHDVVTLDDHDVVTLDDHDEIMDDISEENLSKIGDPSNPSKQDVKINSSWAQSFQKPKIYKNSSGGFTTGLDLMSESNAKALEKRAERFGFEIDETSYTETINSLYESLDVPVDNKSSSRFKSIRLDAVHMRGVEEMSTLDVFDYFKDYIPDAMEWINDYSCNVLWLDEFTAARALLGMSKPLKNKQVDAVDESEKSGGPSSDCSAQDIEEGECKDEDMVTDNSTKTESSSELLPVAVPPGHWRLGVSFPKAKALLLRFATKDDKKQPGSEKRSNYYKKYGNPNYGGLKGLISSSWKRKLQSAHNQQVVQSESSQSSSELTMSSLSEDSAAIKPSRMKPLRMRMYADDEELIIRTQRLNSYGSSHRNSVHSRLGSKFTKDDLCQIGRQHISPLNREYSSTPYDDHDELLRRRMPSQNLSDLRVKIKRIKAEDYLSKHRSPLWRDN